MTTPASASARITFPVKGMTCAACQSAVERSLTHTDGVREASEEEAERRSAGAGFFRIQPMAPGSDARH